MDPRLLHGREDLLRTAYHQGLALLPPHHHQGFLAPPPPLVPNKDDKDDKQLGGHTQLPSTAPQDPWNQDMKDEEVAVFLTPNTLSPQTSKPSLDCAVPAPSFDAGADPPVPPPVESSAAHHRIKKQPGASNTEYEGNDDGECDFKTVAGHVFLSTWQLQPDLSIQYAIRFDSATPDPSAQIEVADVFVNLDEAIRLLTSVSGQTLKVKPPSIKTIWTINVGSSDLDFCPLTEFVYHAALKATGKKFKRVYEGILSGLINQLYRVEAGEAGKKLLDYTEKNYCVNDYGDGFGGKKGKEGRRKQEEDEEYQLDWEHMEDLLEEDASTKVEVKLEQQDQDWVEPQKPKKIKTLYSKRDGEEHECNLCQKSFKNALRLYRHQLQTHPHQQEGHVEKPKALQKQEQRIKEEKKAMADYHDGEEDEEENNETSRFDRTGDFKCKECRKPFIRLMILINHCRREHPDRPEICPEEPLKLGLLETLHERSPDSRDNQFVCGLDLCNLRFTRFLSLVDHERTHTEAYICILCSLCCYSAENLIAHMDLLHQRKSEFICRVCGFFNRKADSLKTHVQQEHMAGAVMFQCEQCPYSTEKKQSLHNHKRVAHTDTNHFCDVCGKSYASGASLYVHKRSHNPNFKKFSCKLCPAKFAYSSGLSYHMAVHTGEKPFQCGQCGAAFGSHTALSRHIKVLHAEEKDMVFQCEHCGKKFPKRMGREYNDHVKVHTGERDHICSICGSGYFSRKMLRKHELKKHANLLPKKATPVRIDPDTVPTLTVTTKAPTNSYS